MSNKLSKTQERKLGHKLSSVQPINVREVVVKEAEKEIKNVVVGEKTEMEVTSFTFKGLTLGEFENGMLLDRAVDREFGVLATEISRNIQKEHKCNTYDKKILAEMVALNYSRVMAGQKAIMLYLTKGEVTDLGMKYLSMMSKEVDRAHRHLTTSLQALQLMNQPPMNMKVNAQVANIANQQLVKNENVNNAK
jgi:hypothetical protein